MSGTLYDTLSLYSALTKYDGQIGLEIETESLTSYDHPRMAFWEAKGDGSLRNYGVEYVLRQPVNAKDQLDQALAEFKDKTGKIKFIKDSITTSVHVHLNVLNETFLTIANFLTAYALAENLLIRFSGPDRLSNLFCLPMCDAEGVHRRMVELISYIEQGSLRSWRANANSTKYSALNLATVTQFGSLEVRSFRGETDIAVIRQWVNLLTALMDYSRQKITPPDILDSYRKIGVEILHEFFGEHSGLLNYDDRSDLMEKNVWYAGKLTTLSKDWSKFGIPEKKKLDKKSFQAVLQDASINQFGVTFDQLTRAQVEVLTAFMQRSLRIANQEPPVALEAAALAGVMADRNNRAARRDVQFARVGEPIAGGVLDEAINFNDFEDE